MPEIGSSGTVGGPGRKARSYPEHSVAVVQRSSFLVPVVVHIVPIAMRSVWMCRRNGSSDHCELRQMLAETSTCRLKHGKTM
jgi:hypothetical protein